ncbi:hypothetical protein BDP55DRAFT_640415 [Colletotrichum godetiae]|uniref:Uncharacterized protein n=1 Tax=Colletotrichum godetiae TaxID=1209918 RepID=A0AAJ0AZC3_9PEZI|nr:uncharacterized protein BDP55DRAFT_640415 [Colletotrichum godetiae]KAK1701082.1 hypothetical protein BDP55DRAFT_640415 [Colletotrichum godetiae]
MKPGLWRRLFLSFCSLCSDSRSLSLNGPWVCAGVLCGHRLGLVLAFPKHLIPPPGPDHDVSHIPCPLQGASASLWLLLPWFERKGSVIDLETRVEKDGRKRVWEWNGMQTERQRSSWERPGVKTQGGRVGESLTCEGQGMKKASSSENFSGTIVQQNGIG